MKLLVGLYLALVVANSEIVGAAERSTPEIILLDARILNALTLLQQLKTNPATKNVPIIAVGNPGEPLSRADEFIDIARPDAIRATVLKRLGLQEAPVKVPPVPAVA